MTDFNITLEKTGPYELSYSYNIANPYLGQDKVSLFVYNREKSCEKSEPITGTSGEGKFVVSSVGYYNVRILRGNDTVHALARSEPVLIGPSVALATETDGKNVIVTYTINEDYSDLKGAWWIGAYKSGNPSNRLYIASKNCTEKVSGEKVIFNINEDLKPTSDSRLFDFRFFFEKSNPHKYSGSTTFEVMARDSLSHTFSWEPSGKELSVSLTVYWERHDEPVWGWDWIGVYSPKHEGGKKVADGYLTAGIKKSNGSGEICFDLTEWYAKYRETNSEPPVFEICYFTHGWLGNNIKVDDMTINVKMDRK